MDESSGMSKVIVSLDMVDGSQSKYAECDPEALPVRDLMWQMMSRDVIGFTVTKKVGLKKLMQLMEEDE